MKDWKSRWLVGIFFGCLTAISLLAVLLEDKTISKTERRNLAQFPAFTVSSFLDGSYMQDLETYFLEQFPGRDVLRMVKSETELHLMKKTDADGYFQVDGCMYQLEPVLKEKNVIRVAKEIERLARENFPSSHCYYAVIPNKSYYLTTEEKYPILDDERIKEIVRQYISGADEIDLFDVLEKNDYYNTDIHWKQENLSNVVEKLFSEMLDTGISNTRHLFERRTSNSPLQMRRALSSGYRGCSCQMGILKPHLTCCEAACVHEEVAKADSECPLYGGDEEDFRIATEQFFGAYAAASAIFSKPDTIYYDNCIQIQNMHVYDYEKQEYVTIYATEKLGKTDDYDFFLWGARALLTIQQTTDELSKQETGKPGQHKTDADGKKLLLFRDSFGSSIAPLLAHGYQEITLVDLRYVSVDYAMQLLGGTEYDDVLFLYSTSILNNSDSLRF